MVTCVEQQCPAVIEYKVSSLFTFYLRHLVLTSSKKIFSLHNREHCLVENNYFRTTKLLVYMLVMAPLWMQRLPLSIKKQIALHVV